MYQNNYFCRSSFIIRYKLVIEKGGPVKVLLFILIYTTRLKKQEREAFDSSFCVAISGVSQQLTLIYSFNINFLFYVYIITP